MASKASWKLTASPVDCAHSRVAIELDGGQHLADPVAYRRDRRKDQLLQENGYFVLRFLAEDVGKELDAVLECDPEGARSPSSVSNRGRTAQICTPTW